MAFIKYPGGKASELKIIKQYLPETIDRYFEPFVGGGAVYFDLDIEHSYINDKSKELMYLYNAVRTQNIFFFRTLHDIDDAWENLKSVAVDNQSFFENLYIKFRDGVIDEAEMQCCVAGYVYQMDLTELEAVADTINFSRPAVADVLSKYLWQKCLSMKKLEQKKHLPEKDIITNIEGALKAGFYMYIRSLYNTFRLHEDLLKTLQNEDAYCGIFAALYVFIRETTYSAMFRYNTNGEFNVPYGGISYNKKSIANIIEKYKDSELVRKLSNTLIECMDFEDFLQKYSPQKDDFVFVDPPYDSEFNEYDQLSFGKNEHEKLADYLLNKCESNFMLIIKNTEFISSLYEDGVHCRNGKDLSIMCFDKKYSVSFMNRNSKDAVHLIIKNY